MAKCVIVLIVEIKRNLAGNVDLVMTGWECVVVKGHSGVNDGCQVYGSNC